MRYDLPLVVELDGKDFKITNKCDYRVILDIFEVFNDEEMSLAERQRIALYIFYKDVDEDISQIKDLKQALIEMYKIINMQSEFDENVENQKHEENRPKLMDWSFDFNLIAPAVSKVLGYDVRTPDKLTHWWTFLGAYQEIGECVFANVVSIRNKIKKGKKLEKHEREFYEQNRKIIDLPVKLTKSDEDWLSSDE